MPSATEMPAIIAALCKVLVDRGAVLNPPATEVAIRQAEARLGFRIPDELRRLYQAFDGTQKETKDWWSFWPLDGLETRDFGPPADGSSSDIWGAYLFFCDALIWLPAFAVCVDPRRSNETYVLAFYDTVEGDKGECSSCIGNFLELVPEQMEDHFMELTDFDHPASDPGSAGQNSGCQPPEI